MQYPKVMTTQSFSIKKMADLEALLPGFAKVWPAIKAECGSRQRGPKSVTFTDEPSRVYLNDGDCCRRFALDLRDMTLSAGLSVSSGEWACHGGDNHDAAVRGVPTTHAVLTCAYNDYYRSFSMTVLVTKLPAVRPMLASLYDGGASR